MYTNPKEYFDQDDACECDERSVTTCVQASQCSVTYEGNYATINVSVVSTVD